MIKIIQGSVLDCNEHYVIQQCDCISTKGTELDNQYSEEFPWASVYDERTPMKGFRHIATPDTRGKPGKIKLYPADEPDEDPGVICIFSQYCPGKVSTGINKSNRYPDDILENREKWFKECFQEIAKLKPKTLAVPYKIGCIGNDCDWQRYGDILEKFTDDNPKCRLYIYNDPETFVDEKKKNLEVVELKKNGNSENKKRVNKNSKPSQEILDRLAITKK